MKLEFESNAVSSPLVSNQIPEEFDAKHSSPETIELLREGIKAAQDGDRANARNLLLRVSEADPQNENAWLWLASISEYPEELLVFLNNVLKINPENERALEWAKATKSLIAKTFVQRGIDAAKDGDKNFAKQCFLQAIVQDPDIELAWLWLASVSDSTDEKIYHLQKVLAINPENENALTSIRNAREQIAKAKLPHANAAAISGDHVTANDLLDELLVDAPNFEDAWMLKAHISESFEAKISAFERVIEINPENPVARANIDSLKMISGDNDDDLEVPKPAESFENSSLDFAPSEQHTEVMEGTYDESLEQSAEAESAPEVQFHDEEPVSFEEAIAEDENEEASDFALDAVEGEETEELEASDESAENDEQDSVSFSEETSEEDSEPEAQFEDATQEEEVVAFEDVDHDYVSENVDFAESDEDVEYLELEQESSGEVNSEDTDNSFESGEAEEVGLELAESEGVDVDFDALEEDAVEFDAADQEAADEESLEFEAEEASEVEAAEFEAVDEQDAEFDSVEHVDENEYVQDDNEYTAESMEAQSEESAHDSDKESYDGGDAQLEEETQQADSASPEMPSFESPEHLNQELPSDEDSKHQSCPYCSEANEAQAFACHRCKAIFTISDIEMILSHTKADKEIIFRAVKRMESQKSLRGVVVDELKQLGIGYINLKDYRKGFDYLQEAAKKDPSDVLLVSQIDALAVRLAEIEEHERDHEPTTVGKKILVVDDSPTVRKLISGKLEKCGHEAICAVDGMDALAKINEEIPDLILLDITMPRMDGYQVCKLIRSNEATKDVPVVMISGKDGFFDKVRGRMAGTSNYITKPFGPETLMKAVNEYIH